MLLHFPRHILLLHEGRPGLVLAVRHRPFQRVARVQAGPGPASLPVLILLQRLALLASKFFGSKATGCWHLHFLSPSVTHCFHNHTLISTLLALSFSEELILVPRWIISSEWSFQEVCSGYWEEVVAWVGYASFRDGHGPASTAGLGAELRTSIPQYGWGP